MPEGWKPGARNPKQVRFSISVTDEINTRIERLADVAGMNKSTMAAILVAAGLRGMEVLIMGMPAEEVAQASASLARRMADDVRSVESNQSEPEAERVAQS